MDTTIVVNWAFSLNESIRDYVKNNYREDSHRWPANYGFDAKGFSWNDKYLIVILYDKNLQIPIIGMVENLNFSIPFNNPSIDNIDEIHHYLYEKFSLRQNDSLLIVPITEGKNVYEI